MAIFVKEVLFHSLEYEELLKLRKKLIYRPWTIEFTADDRYRDSGTTLFGLYKDDTIIGSVLIRKIDNNMCEIKDLAIDYPYQNKGLGKGLLTFAEQEIASNGYETIQINSRASLKPFFKAQGYERVDVNPDKLDPLIIKYQKSTEKIGKNKFLPNPPLNREIQTLPIGIVSKDGDLVQLFKELRLKMPKEDFLYFDVSKDLEMSEEDLHYGIQRYLARHSKLMLLSPMVPVYKNAGFKKSQLLDTAVVLAKAAIGTSLNNTVLMLAPATEMSIYKNIMKALKPSLDILALSFDPDINLNNNELDASFYNELEVLKAKLLETQEIFDTVVYFNLNLFKKHDLLQETLRKHYNKNISLIHPIRELSSAVREFMIEENLSVVDEEFGKLKVVSNVPQKTRKDLEKYLSVEGPMAIEKL